MKITNRQPIETADASSNRGVMWKELRKLILSAALLVVVIYYSIGGIVDLIVPGISIEREASLFSGWNFEQKEHEDDTEALSSAQKILETMVVDETVPKLPYRLILLDQKSPNAFAFPGGTIGLTKGLLDSIDNDMALAFVLGHELGHFYQRDHLRGLGRAIGGAIAFSLVFGGEVGHNQFTKTFAHILSRNYSRDQEEGADLFGLELVFRTYGGTDDCDQLFEVLQKQDTTPDWAYMFSTHPAPANRIEQLRQEGLKLKESTGK